MNVYDSARMVDVLGPLGYRPVEEPDAADMVILNTCHIREKAAEKVFSELGRLRRLQKRAERNGRRMVIAVAGCVAQAESEEIQRRAPHVDIVVGPQMTHALPGLIAQVSAGERAVATDFPAEDKFDHFSSVRQASAVVDFLTIQEGCDKFCTFCVVPYTRGAEFSRPVDAIVEEAETMVARGTREICLLGQNVNAFHGRDDDRGALGLGPLIRRLAKIDGLARIRYTTSHPRDVDADLIAAHRDESKLMPFLHLPIQSGSDRVLGAMNRRYTADDYRRIVDRLRAARQDLALSSDFIVGFPGETEDDFAATMALVADVEFAQAFSFKFSPRPGTPAAALKDHVPEATKTTRLATLQDLLEQQKQAFNRSIIGTDVSVLYEKPGRHAGQLVGRSPYLQPVHVTATAAQPGDIERVRVIECHANSLAAIPDGHEQPVALAAGPLRRAD